MKNKHQLLIYSLLVSSAVFLTIIICAHQFRWGKYFPDKKVTPKEMVRILKTANVDFVATTHAGGIGLETKLGFRYHTTWKAIPGTDYENTHDSLNLVMQILRDERGLEPNKDFSIMMQ